MNIKDSIQQMIDKFHSKVENDGKMREELSGVVTAGSTRSKRNSSTMRMSV